MIKLAIQGKPEIYGLIPYSVRLKNPDIARKPVPSIKPNGTVTVTGFPHPSPKFKDVKLIVLVDRTKNRANYNKESSERNNTKVFNCIY